MSLVNNMEQQEQKDMTVMEKSGGYSYSCDKGYHDFNKSLTRLEVSTDGLTRVFMTCYICNREIIIDAPLNINDLIKKENENIQYNTPGNDTNQKTQENEDEFWKKIKSK